jgi:hypothetical protein
MNITFEWLKSESGDAWLRNAPHEEIQAALVSASGAIDRVTSREGTES